jgi:hypothetical protein
MLCIYLLHDIESWRNVFRSCLQIVDRYNLILSWLTSDHSKYALWAHLQYIYAYNICRNYMQFQDGVVTCNTRIVVQNMYNFGMSSLSCRMIVDKFKLRLTEKQFFLLLKVHISQKVLVKDFDLFRFLWKARKFDADLNMQFLLG